MVDKKVSSNTSEIGKTRTSSADDKPTGGNWLSAVAWVLALAAVGAAVYVTWQVKGFGLAPESQPESPPLEASKSESDISLPALSIPDKALALSRVADLKTIIPDRPDPKVVHYTVDQGDSVFGIAEYFKIEPETVLWANYDVLNDNPDYLEPGMELNIPPINGVYYTWQEGDTIENVAACFEANAEEITLYPGNKLDLIEPVIETGNLVMVPGGRREFRQWVVPTIPRGVAGVSSLCMVLELVMGGTRVLLGLGASFIRPSTTLSPGMITGRGTWVSTWPQELGTRSGQPTAGWLCFQDGRPVGTVIWS